MTFKTMNEIKLVWRTDVHVSDRPPRSRLDDWNETLFGKLRQVGEIAREEGAHAVLDGGDFFHIKSPRETSHETVFRVADLHKNYPCPVYANVGNHDVVYGDYQFLQRQPLEVLYSTGVFQRLYDDYELILEGDVTVRVVGVPYHGTEYDFERFKIAKGDEDYLVVCAHVLAREGTGGRGAMYGGEDILGYDQIRDLDPDVWCFGHWHKDQGITEIAKDKWVVNIGSLSRGSLSQDNLDRQPAVAVLGFSEEGVSVRRINLDVQPATEIFDVDERVRVESKTFMRDAFATSLQRSLQKSKGKPLEEVVRDADVPSEVKERALHYVEKTKT